MLRKFLLPVLFLAVAATSAAQAQTKSRLNQILERGSIRVGTTGDFNPMSVRDPATNSFKGFDVEAAEELAKDMGVKVEFVQAEWPTLIAGVVSNKYDIFMGGSSMNMARARTVGFTLPYTEAGTLPVVLKENAGKFKSWNDINQAGVKVAVTLGTVFEEQAKAHFPKAQIVAVQPPAAGFQEVMARRADVTITSNVEASQLVQRYDQLVITARDEPRNRRPFAYMAAQDDVVWLNFLNSWVTMKKADGYFERLEAKWMPR